MHHWAWQKCRFPFKAGAEPRTACINAGASKGGAHCGCLSGKSAQVSPFCCACWGQSHKFKHRTRAKSRNVPHAWSPVATHRRIDRQQRAHPSAQIQLAEVPNAWRKPWKRPGHARTLLAELSSLSLSDLIFVSRVQTLRDVVLSMRDNLGLEPVQSLRFVRRAFGRRGTCIQPLSHGQIESGADL